MRSLTIVLLIFLLYNCSTTQKGSSLTTTGKVLRFERTGIMDTITVVVHGHVLDMEKNNNIRYASIKIQGNSVAYVSISDSLGNFKFSHIPAGIYKVEVTSMGYNQKDTVVTMGTGEIWSWEFALSKRG